MTLDASSKKHVRILAIVAAILALIYAAQVVTPLRLNTDASAFLTIASSYADGMGFTVRGEKSHFPPAFPFVIASLERIGIANSFTFVAVNLICLAVTIVCGMSVLKRWLKLGPRAIWVCVILYLLSWGLVKHITIPVSEMSYSAVAMLSLYLLLKADAQPAGGKQWLYLLLGIAVVALSMSVRLIGVALIPAAGWVLLFTVVRTFQKSHAHAEHAPHPSHKRRNLILVISAAAVVLPILGWAITKTTYFQEGAGMFKESSIGQMLLFIERQRCVELASLFINLPNTVVQKYEIGLVVIGAIILLSLLLLIALRLRHPSAADFYIGSYTGILLVWPYSADVRFWVPVLLLLFGLFAWGVTRYSGIVKRLTIKSMSLPHVAGVLWMGGFALLGIAAIVFSTRLSFAGSRFNDEFGSGVARNSYRFAAGQPTIESLPPVDPNVVFLLRRYGGRAYNAPPPAELPKAQTPSSQTMSSREP